MERGDGRDADGCGEGHAHGRRASLETRQRPGAIFMPSKSIPETSAPSRRPGDAGEPAAGRSPRSVTPTLLALAIILLGPVELVAPGEHQALQVPVLSPLLQPLLFQQGHQRVSLLHRPHDLRQDLLLLLQFRGALLRVCGWEKMFVYSSCNYEPPPRPPRPRRGNRGQDKQTRNLNRDKILLFLLHRKRL